MIRDKSRERGHSILEVALFLPWLFFLFFGVLDAGFYAYAFISTASAARVAALYTSSSSTRAADTSGACTYALEELRTTPNVGSGITTCTALPVMVTATSVTGPDGSPASSVSVTYQTVPLVPIPGLLSKQVTITRSVQMRVKG